MSNYFMDKNGKEILIDDWVIGGEENVRVIGLVFHKKDVPTIAFNGGFLRCKEVEVINEWEEHREWRESGDKFSERYMMDKLKRLEEQLIDITNSFESEQKNSIRQRAIIGKDIEDLESRADKAAGRIYSLQQNCRKLNNHGLDENGKTLIEAGKSEKENFNEIPEPA